MTKVVVKSIDRRRNARYLVISQDAAACSIQKSNLRGFRRDLCGAGSTKRITHITRVKHPNISSPDRNPCTNGNQAVYFIYFFAFHGNAAVGPVLKIINDHFIA